MFSCTSPQDQKLVLEVWGTGRLKERTRALDGEGDMLLKYLGIWNLSSTEMALHFGSPSFLSQVEKKSSQWEQEADESRNIQGHPTQGVPLGNKWGPLVSPSSFPHLLSQDLMLWWALTSPNHSQTRVPF